MSRAPDIRLAAVILCGLLWPGAPAEAAAKGAASVTSAELRTGYRALEGKRWAWSVWAEHEEQALLTDAVRKRPDGGWVWVSEALDAVEHRVLSRTETLLDPDGTAAAFMREDEQTRYSISRGPDGRLSEQAAPKNPVTDEARAAMKAQGFSWNSQEERFERDAGPAPPDLLVESHLPYLCALLKRKKGAVWSGPVISDAGLRDAVLRWEGIGDLTVNGEVWDTRMIVLGVDGGGPGLELHVQDGSLRLQTIRAAGVLISPVDPEETAQRRAAAAAQAKELAERAHRFVGALHRGDVTELEDLIDFAAVQQGLADIEAFRVGAGEEQFQAAMAPGNGSNLGRFFGSGRTRKIPAEFAGELKAALGAPEAARWKARFGPLPPDPTGVRVFPDGVWASCVVSGGGPGYDVTFLRVGEDWKVVWWSGLLELGLQP